MSHMGPKALHSASFSNEPGGRKPLGRPKGRQNKFTALVKNTILNVFEELQGDPVANMYEWAVQNPTEFYKIASKLLPIEVEAAVRNTITVKLLDDDEPDAEDKLDEDYVEFEDVNEDEDLV